MTSGTNELTTQIVSRRPVARSGASGNTVEHVTLRDGRRYVCKRVSPAEDWISRATGDDGRSLRMWQGGMFARMPASIDHAIVAIEPNDDGWTVFMRDVSAALITPGRRLSRAEVRRVLAALADLHAAFRGTRAPDLCTLTDRYNLLSPATARREAGTGPGDTISKCWDVFVDLAPDDVVGPILALAEDPAPLVAQLDACEQTVIHGDVRLTNLGLDEDRVVLVDWGERTGSAPAYVELASFLIFDGRHLDVTREDLIADYRALPGVPDDERALDLALIGGLVQLAPHTVGEIVWDGTEQARRTAEAEVAWWSGAVRRAFERSWSPS